MFNLKNLLQAIFAPNSKPAFIGSINDYDKVLDVGCGNNSPYKFKKIKPKSYYVGLDIGDYNQNYGTNQADEYILTDPENFDKEISKFKDEFDIILSTHNLEHCNDYIAVTLNMINALKKGGKIYISFPCEESVNFPKRIGTLNFYDDDTHKLPIPFENYKNLIKDNNIEIIYSNKRFRPFAYYLMGMIFEPISIMTKKILPFGFTWAYYGFESIIIGRKK